MEPKERRYDIDWLRVIAFYILIFYHTGMIFVPWEFHIKNNPTAEWFETWMAFLSQWRLPLLFLISGVGVCYALGKRSAGQFMGERTRRLFIPIVLGLLVIVPPQIYVERISHGVQYASYFDFWKTVFNFIPYPEGNTSWHHLWFVVYIFFFSFLMLPLFLYLRSVKAAILRERISRYIKRRPNSIYLFMLPLIIIYYTMSPLFPTTHKLIGDWYNLSFSLVFFVFGFLISVVDGFWDIIAAKRKQSLIISAIPISFLILFVWGPTFEIMSEDTVFFFILYGFLKTLLISTFILGVLGYGRVLLNKPGKFLNWANESVYPLYILHQTVELIIGYFIIKLNWPVMPKFFLVVAGTFGISILLYEIFIRRFNFMRFFFGMKMLPRQEKAKKELKSEPLPADEGNY